MIISKAAYRLCRWLFPLLSDRDYARLLEKRPAVTRLDFPDAPITMSARSRVELARARACAKEPETVQWLRDELRPGDTFYDIGGNAGAYSLVALHLGLENVRAVIIEPASANYELLVRNCLLNQLQDRVITVPVALGDSCTRQQLCYSKYTPGAASHTIRAEAESGRSESILIFPLDQLIEQFSLPVPNVIKLDTDGYEHQALQGALHTLSRPEVRSLLVELDMNCPQAAATLEVLRQAGWSIRQRHPRGTPTAESRLENIVLSKTAPLLP